MPDGEVENRILPGLVSVTFRKLTPPQIVELVSLGRLVGVEWGGDVHVPHGDLARGEEVGRMTRDAGLAVAAYGSYFEVGESEAEGLSFASVLETALALGAPLIRVWAGRSGPAQTDATTRQRIIADSQRIAELAAAARVPVAFEFHGGTLTENAESALDLLSAVHHPNLATLWQAPVGMDDAACVASLCQVLPQVRNVHVFHLAPDNPADRRPLAEGAARWRTLFNILSETNRAHYALLEFVANDDPQSFLRDAQTLRELCASAGASRS
jgi:sugar phosphate isomerase/epimerase